ncbi:MAG: helix-hairpin-helix domain-containing protein [archaeon]
MNNTELATILRDMASILQMKGVEWKPQAYRRAARSLESLQEDISKVYKESGIKGLEEIPGVGEGIAKKIVQYLKSGKIKEYEELKRTIPKPVADLMKIPSIGPKKAKILYNKLHIKTIEELEKAAKEHKLQRLRAFKQKTEENILQGIEILKAGKFRRPLKEVLPIAEKITSRLRKVKGVSKAEVCGSIRRKKGTVKDMDLLVIAKDPEKVVDTFTKLKQIKRVQAKGMTKASVRLKNGMQADLRVVPQESFATALQYFTGSKDHNIQLRIVAIKKGYKLSEYGLFNKKTGRRIPVKTEKELYKKLGFKYIKPEQRLGKGEI